MLLIIFDIINFLIGFILLFLIILGTLNYSEIFYFLIFSPILFFLNIPISIIIYLNNYNPYYYISLLIPFAYTISIHIYMSKKYFKN